jgi:hypothetical protein
MATFCNDGDQSARCVTGRFFTSAVSFCIHLFSIVINLKMERIE